MYKCFPFNLNANLSSVLREFFLKLNRISKYVKLYTTEIGEVNDFSRTYSATVNLTLYVQSLEISHCQLLFYRNGFNHGRGDISLYLNDACAISIPIQFINCGPGKPPVVSFPSNVSDAVEVRALSRELDSLFDFMSKKVVLDRGDS